MELINAQLCIIEQFGLEVIKSGVQIPKASPKPLCTELFLAHVPRFRQTASFPREGSFPKKTPTTIISTTSCTNSPINSHLICASQQSFLWGAELLIAALQLLPPRSSQTCGAWPHSRFLAAEGTSISSPSRLIFPLQRHRSVFAQPGGWCSCRGGSSGYDLAPRLLVCVYPRAEGRVPMEQPLIWGNNVWFPLGNS